MNLKNAPWRAYHKLRLDGARTLLRAIYETVSVNILGYRIIHQRLLSGRLSRMSREELRSEGHCQVYEDCTGEVPSKQEGGVPSDDSAVETYWPGDRFVCSIPNVTLLGPVGPGVTNDRRLIEETVAIPHKSDRRIGVAMAKALVKTGPRQVRQVITGNGIPDCEFETAAILYPPWNNYYHWTIETLPRIRSLERYAEVNGEYPVLLVPDSRPSWMDETLEQINYQGRVEGWSGEVAYIEKLVIPVFPDPTPEECKWLRARMQSTTQTTEVEAQKNIFVSREDATVRRVKNMSEIRPVLRKHNFETHVLSELTIAEQIGLFATADIVVAPHGAGLANLVYADDISVIELFGRKKIASFARLAHMLGHEYTPVDCEQRGVNITVNPEQLETAIGSIQSDW